MKSIKYLGIMLDEKLNFNQHIKHTATKANKIMNKIISIGQSKFHLPLRIIRNYHNTILTAIITYGSSVWAHRLKIKQNAAIVDRVQRNILLRLSGAYKTTAKDALLVAVGICPISLEVIRRAATYWLRKGDQEKASAILETQVRNMQEVTNCILNKWQHQWDESSTGRRTYSFFPDIKERLQLNHVTPSRGMIQYITGHGPYQENLYRLGIINSPNCECGEISATAEHVTWECEITRNVKSEIRAILAQRQLFEIIRIPNLYSTCDEIANAVSAFLKKKYVESLRKRG